MMRHLITKQVIQVELKSNKNAFQIQQHISDHYWRDVVPLLNSVFDELSNNMEVVRMHKVEIDLGDLTETEVLGEWDDKSMDALRAQLMQSFKVKLQERTIVQEKVAVSICRQWLFYMQHGYLPWNVNQVDQAWYDAVLETLATDVNKIVALRKLLMLNVSSRRRIVLQHSAEFLTTLMEVLTAQKHQDLAVMIGAVNALRNFISVSTNDTVDIWMTVFHVGSTIPQGCSSQNLIREAMKKHISFPLILQVQEFSDEIHSVLPIIKALNQEYSTASDKIVDSSESNVSKEIMDTASDPVIAFNGDEVFVTNTGVVLLHPFLSSLFKRLGLVSEGNFVSDLARCKAMYLIHYMATGHVSAHEYELVTAKILCEWPTNIPVERNVQISANEIQEALRLLEAVVEQWSVLKNTSIGGLQEGFLQRQGKIYVKNENLFIRMETSAIDVLLDQLPWVLSMVKLPWMNKMIRVEWR